MSTQETNEPHEFSSTQVNLPPAFRQAFHRAIMAIPEEDLAEDGREMEPHITVKYGLHDEQPDATATVLKGESPIEAKLGKLSLFKNDNFDVVKLDVDSPDLHRLNGAIAELPHTDTYPDYTPHMTLAYVKPGRGAKYEGKHVHGLSGKSVPFTHIVFSAKNRTKTRIPLRGKRAAIPSPSPIK